MVVTDGFYRKASELQMTVETAVEMSIEDGKLVIMPAGRPALVLSPSAYNGRVGLAIVCPITSQVKGYPFEVPLPDGGALHGVVLSDQARSLDWRGRQVALITRLPNDVTDTVIAKLAALVGFGHSHT